MLGGSASAFDLDEESSPARAILASYADGAGDGLPAAEHPWGKPELDFGREVTDQVAAG
jgi:hypothetical protein